MEVLACRPEMQLLALAYNTLLNETTINRCNCAFFQGIADASCRVCRVENDEEWLGQLQGIVSCTHGTSPSRIFVLVRWYLLTPKVLLGARMNVLCWDEGPDGSPAMSMVPADSILSAAVVMPHPDPEQAEKGMFVHNHLFLG